MKITIADLNERISVIYFEIVRNERGDIINTQEVERCRVWAKVYPLTGKINDAQPEKTNKINYRVTIRYRADLMPDDEILWRGRRLKILSPPYNLEGKRDFTTFDCEEAVPDGAK